MYIMLNNGLLPKKSGNHQDQSANFILQTWEKVMNTSVKRWLTALAVSPVLYSGVALAGRGNAAGTLLGEEKLGTNETVGLIVLAVVAVAVVVYLRRRT
jgi:hypothetical protein